MFENPRRGRQVRNFTTNAPKILDLKSFSEQIFSRKLPLGALDEILHVSNDEITPVSEMDYEDNQKLVIFDDYVCDKNQRRIIDYFIQGRHMNCSVIYLSQSFYKTPKDIRLNCSHYCLYEFPSSREANRISDEMGVDKEIYRAATKKPFTFLYVDKPRKRIAKNFTSNIS